MEHHIVIDARQYSTSSGRYVRKLIKNLELIDHENRYSVLLSKGDFDKIKLSQNNFTGVLAEHTQFTFEEQLDFRKFLVSLKPDLVHFAFVHQPVWYKGKTVTTVHDLTTLRFLNPANNRLVMNFKQVVYGYVIKKVAKKSSHIITPSNFVKQDLIAFTGINKNKISVTYEAADKISEKSEPIKKLSDKKFILYVGQPLPHKNLRRLIKAFVILQKTQPGLRLVLVGKKDANYQAHQKYVDKKKIKNVILTGFVSEGELRWLYENCQAYVFASLSEGFGLPGLEAMAHGAPVVSSDATCLPEVYGKAAHYFNPTDAEDMAEMIEQVLTDNDLRDNLIKAGKEQIKKYSWETMAKQTLAVYKQALG